MYPHVDADTIKALNMRDDTVFVHNYPCRPMGTTGDGKFICPAIYCMDVYGGYV